MSRSIFTAFHSRHNLALCSTRKKPFPFNFSNHGNGDCRNQKAIGCWSVVGSNSHAVLGCGRSEDHFAALERIEGDKGVGLKELPVLYDDGYGTETVKDFFEAAKSLIESDGGPPRWFCPSSCGHPLLDSPTLLYLPGIDGTGLGITLHHKSLGKFFEVRCLHIPVSDRTPFEGLVNIVEEATKLEYAESPKKPIYLLGDSIGGCIALSVAARNPNIDLILIVVNPATSFARSQLQYLFPILEVLPDGVYSTVPRLLKLLTDLPVNVEMVSINSWLSPDLTVADFGNMGSLLPHLNDLAAIIPMETFRWKMRLLKTGAAFTNSLLPDVCAEVLVLASCKDNFLPSEDEAKLLQRAIPDCKVRCFNNNGHFLFLEGGIDLMTIIKGTLIYRRQSRKHDCILDFLPPSMAEFRHFFGETMGLLRYAISPVMLSTKENGEIVKGLTGVPTAGPVLLVGNHMLLGLDVWAIHEQFLREKHIMIRGLAIPMAFASTETFGPEFSLFDFWRVFGATPVSASTNFRLLKAKSHILLYPGGTQEALHNKGEQYQLHWPEKAEFVRMAAKFGATIVPFGVVGEDDLANVCSAVGISHFQVVLGYSDMIKVPILKDFVQELSPESVRSGSGTGTGTGTSEKAAKLNCGLPILSPKLPGRFYYLFGKPIKTKGRETELLNKEAANELYLQIKSEVESYINYLLKKREEDPYRGIIDRTLYRAISAPSDQVPTFEP